LVLVILKEARLSLEPNIDQFQLNINNWKIENKKNLIGWKMTKTVVGIAGRTPKFSGSSLRSLDAAAEVGRLWHHCWTTIAAAVATVAAAN